MPPHSPETPTRAMSRFLAISSQAVEVPWWAEMVTWVADTMPQDAAHDWQHLTRVWQNARQIWSTEDPDDLLWFPISIAVLCHDLVNVPKDQEAARQLASTQSAQQTLAWLRAHTNVVEDQLGLIDEAIRTHSYSSGLTPSSLPARIVTDADRLDAIGAHGIVRIVQVGQSLGRAFYHLEDPLASGRDVDDTTWSVDHFFAKILKIPPLMHTAAGKKIARTRAHFVVDFLRQLTHEIEIPSDSLDAWNFS